MNTIIICIVGLVFGSFLHAIGRRIPHGESIVFPPSHCPACSTRLKPFELIPLISFCLLKGRCKYCRVKIPIVYPLSEIGTALLFLYAWVQFGYSLEFIVSIVFISFLIVVTVSDLYTQLIPNLITASFLVSVLVYLFFISTDPVYDAYLGMLVGFLLPLTIAYFSRGGLGGGDIKLFAVLGLYFGVEGVLLVIMLSAVLGCFIVGSLLLVGKIQRDIPFPFGPFIALAALLVFFYGDDLQAWYISVFNI